MEPPGRSHHENVPIAATIVVAPSARMTRSSASTAAWYSSQMTRPVDTREALLRAATYLKWFRDRSITVDVEPPDDIGEIIVLLERSPATIWSINALPRTSSSLSFRGPPVR